MRVPLALERVDDAAFDAALREAYEAGSNAISAAEGLEETTDLAFLAQALCSRAPTTRRSSA